MFAYCLNNPVSFIDPNGLCTYVGDHPWLGLTMQYIDCKNVFCARSSAYRPHIAPKVDVTERLNKEMKKNAKQLRDYGDKHDIVETGLYFKGMVENGADWDLKNQPDWCLSKHVTYVYNGTDYRYDAIGNIHYGYVGSAYFSDEVLLMAAGYAQLMDGTSKWYFIGSWFDDPYDQMSIRVGCELWDEGGI